MSSQDSVHLVQLGFFCFLFVPLTDLLPNARAGPLFIGCILDWFLFGGLTIQMYNYYRAYCKTDGLTHKITIIVLFVVVGLQVCFVSSTVWSALVVHWGDDVKFFEGSTPSKVVPALDGVATAIVQIFFATRIYRFQRYDEKSFLSAVARLMTVAVVATSLTQCAGAMALSIKYGILGSNLADLRFFVTPGKIWLIGSFVCDTIIAATTYALLMRARKFCTVRCTETMIDRLLFATVETAAVTVIVACAQLILFLKSQETFIHLAMTYILGTLYANVLLATLNNRRGAAECHNSSLAFSVHVHTIASSIPRNQMNEVHSSVP